jgi:hypothetical protein
MQENLSEQGYNGRLVVSGVSSRTELRLWPDSGGANEIWQTKNYSAPPCKHEAFVRYLWIFAGYHPTALGIPVPRIIGNNRRDAATSLLTRVSSHEWQHPSPLKSVDNNRNSWYLLYCQPTRWEYLPFQDAPSAWYFAKLFTCIGSSMSS